MNISRRNFLKTTVAATVVLPSMGRDAFGNVSANDKINVGLIGCKGNGSLCAKYAHLGNIAARVNTSLVYDDKAKTFKSTPEANRYIKPMYRAPWKFPA